MKKLLIIFSLVSLLASCGVDYTSHSFSFRNLSSDTLELRYKKVSMDTVSIRIKEPYIYPSESYLTDYVEQGKEDRLSEEAILDVFEVFECIKGTDTIRLDSSTISKWRLIYGYGGVDSGFNKHGYRIEITDADLE